MAKGGGLWCIPVFRRRGAAEHGTGNGPIICQSHEHTAARAAAETDNFAAVATGNRSSARWAGTGRTSSSRNCDEAEASFHSHTEPK